MTNNDIRGQMLDIGRKAVTASRKLAGAGTAQKNLALTTLATLLRSNAEEIGKANELDLQRARAAGLAPAFVDRLAVTPKVLEVMALGCEQIAALPDPIGEVTDMHPQSCGIMVGKMRVPLGVLGIIFEARPNVTIDASALAIKSGNAAILRGGSEAFETNRILGSLVQQALQSAGLDRYSIQTAPTADRAFVGEMITAKGLIDVIIPRGGKGLIARLEKEASIPMIHHLDGICNTYIDRDCDMEMAVSIADNAKTQRYSPCNATENLLVHADVAEEFLPRIGAIYAEKGVEMRADERCLAILSKAGLPCVPASAEDWDTEYNAPIIAIAMVESLDAAVDFINDHGSKHTDSIVTNSYQATNRFLREVDSGSVMVNASTRLADGFVYGLGAEIGISTGKLHARGPVGLEGLTSQKYIVIGHGEGRR